MPNWQWTEYELTLTYKDGQPFKFSNEYILPSVSLQIKFDIDAEDTTAQNRLAGMTFDTAYESSTGRFIIIRNDQYEYYNLQFNFVSMNNRKASKYAKYLALACYNTSVKEFPKKYHPRHGWHKWKDPYAHVYAKPIKLV